MAAALGPVTFVAKPVSKAKAFTLAIALSFVFVHGADAALLVESDAALLRALRSDGELRRCDCIRAAVWLNESYPRITVDASRWKKLSRSARIRLSARALKIAEATYLAEFASADQYEEIFVVDQRGKLLSTYAP